MSNIIIFTGPMKCGKTTKLIEEFEKLENTRSMAFKPLIDNRFSDLEIISRNNNHIKSTNIIRTEDLLKFENQCDNYFIDEFQFLKGNIEPIIQLMDKNKNFFISGLNLTTERKPFLIMTKILCLADKVEIMTANCDICGQKAKYTACIVPKNQDILIGEDIYRSVCEKCYLNFESI